MLGRGLTLLQGTAELPPYDAAAGMNQRSAHEHATGTPLPSSTAGNTPAASLMPTPAPASVPMPSPLLMSERSGFAPAAELETPGGAQVQQYPMIPAGAPTTARPVNDTRLLCAEEGQHQYETSYGTCGALRVCRARIGAAADGGTQA
jgi:hypothetical protein